MRASYDPKATLKGRVMREVEREYSRRYQEHQNAIQKDISVQLVAAVLHTLNICEGFGAKRLRRFFKELNGTFEDMNGVGFAGEFDCDDLAEQIREKFGIDLKSEITCVKSEWKK